jgi:hypothetical protein
MADTAHAERPAGLEGFVADWSSDQRAFKGVLNHDPDQFVTDGAGFRKFTMKAGQDAMLPDELSVVVDGWAPGGDRKRRCLVHRCNSVENVESAYQKDGLWLYPVTFKALYVDASTSPVEWIDEIDDES